MTTPSSTPESDALLAIFRAADGLRRFLTERLAPHGLTLPQYNVLRILRGAGGQLPTMEIRERMMERSPGITRIVDALVAKELIERHPVPEDRRQVICQLTRLGAKKLKSLDPAMDTSDIESLGSLPAGRLVRLTKDLRAIAEAATDA